MVGRILQQSWKEMKIPIPFGWDLQAEEGMRRIQEACFRTSAPEGEGYFAIVEGHNHRLYIGTHANAKNSYLVEFDPKAETVGVEPGRKSVG
jgi:hypothetical protein